MAGDEKRHPEIGAKPGLTGSSSLRKIRQALPSKVNISFWLLGLCNNFGYVVMLSAAHDVLTDVSS